MLQGGRMVGGGERERREGKCAVHIPQGTYCEIIVISWTFNLVGRIIQEF